MSRGRKGKQKEERKEGRKVGSLPLAKQRREGMRKPGSLFWILTKRHLYRHGTFSRIIESFTF